MISFVVISKDEPALEETLHALEEQARALSGEVVVVDASEGRLDAIRRSTDVRWIDFTRPPGVRVSIPHQRNVGVRNARGDVIVFTDSGCVPAPDWAEQLLKPILSGAEQVTVGRTVPRGKVKFYDAGDTDHAYLAEAPTVNIAFTRSAFEMVGGFDESFEYGSDVDFTWRLADAGIRLRRVSGAVVSADWGGTRRQLRRAWTYGRARARLYVKHPSRLRGAWRRDPVPFAYSVLWLGSPFLFACPPLLAVLLVPLLRNRNTGSLLTVADHLIYGAGFLREFVLP